MTFMLHLGSNQNIHVFNQQCFKFGLGQIEPALVDMKTVYNFDGKIGAFPCAEEYFTQRKSKKGPKGTKSVRSVNVDSEFYHNLFWDPGGVYDAIERICPWLRGTQYRIQQDGARPHASEGEIEDLEAGCDGDGWSCIFITQPQTPLTPI